MKIGRHVPGEASFIEQIAAPRHPPRPPGGPGASRRQRAPGAPTVAGRAGYEGRPFLGRKARLAPRERIRLGLEE
jgi:hypothetical protein